MSMIRSEFVALLDSPCVTWNDIFSCPGTNSGASLRIGELASAAAVAAAVAAVAASVVVAVAEPVKLATILNKNVGNKKIEN